LSKGESVESTTHYGFDFLEYIRKTGDKRYEQRIMDPIINSQHHRAFACDKATR